jgi:membrane fusion protein, multidrug efflux system
VDQVTPSAKKKWNRPETWLPPGIGAPIGNRSLNLHSMLLTGGAIILLAAACICGHEWWTKGRFIVSTDDAYVQADYVIISPKVSDYLSDGQYRTTSP